MDTPDNYPKSQPTPQFSPITHALLVIGLLAIAAFVEIRTRGIGDRILLQTVPEILGTALAPMPVGFVASRFGRKEKSQMRFYMVTYVTMIVIAFGQHAI